MVLKEVRVAAAPFQRNETHKRHLAVEKRLQRTGLKRGKGNRESVCVCEWRKHMAERIRRKVVQ